MNRKKKQVRTNMVSLIKTETEISIDPDGENKMRLLTEKKLFNSQIALPHLNRFVKSFEQSMHYIAACVCKLL